MNGSDIALGEPAIADTAGMVASIACAIHCAAMPIVIGYLPMLGLSWLADPSFHRVMAVVCFALALSAFLPGWKRHGSLAPALFGSLGVGLLSVTAFGLEGECCPSCVQPPVQQPTATCSDPDCAHCLGSTPSAVASVDSASSPFAWVAPLLTPLGGVFLVAGHVSNHRRSCLCCGNDSCSNGSAEAGDHASA